jgi:LysR family transcriptional regulator for bpeEF and oprC
MDRLDVMRLFLRVADTGSFSRTARAAGIAQPTVSKQIAALEKRLGAQLLRRTSRGLSVTEAGQAYYESAVRLLGDFDAAEARVGHGQIAPSGRVRVAISAAFGRIYVIPRLPEFFARFPDVSFDFDISERHVNLIEDGIDVAIRMGHLSDSTLLARRIGSMRAMTVATPDYLKAFGEPGTPFDLQGRTGIAFMFQGAVRSWRFKGPDGPLTVTPKEILRTNDAEHIRAAVLAGIGIGHAAGWLFAADVRSGALRHLLQDYTPPPDPINAVWAGGRVLPGKVKVFIDFLADICAGDDHLKIG